MKKLLLLLVAVFAFSCSDSSDQNNPQNLTVEKRSPSPFELIIIPDKDYPIEANTSGWTYDCHTNYDLNTGAFVAHNGRTFVFVYWSDAAPVMLGGRVYSGFYRGHIRYYESFMSDEDGCDGL